MAGNLVKANRRNIIRKNNRDKYKRNNNNTRLTKLTIIPININITNKKNDKQNN